MSFGPPKTGAICVRTLNLLAQDFGGWTFINPNIWAYPLLVQHHVMENQPSNSKKNCYVFFFVIGGHFTHRYVKNYREGPMKPPFSLLQLIPPFYEGFGGAVPGVWLRGRSCPGESDASSRIRSFLVSKPGFFEGFPDFLENPQKWGVVHSHGSTHLSHHPFFHGSFAYEASWLWGIPHLLKPPYKTS